jgi:hypothetical protein
MEKLTVNFMDCKESNLEWLHWTFETNQLVSNISQPFFTAESCKLNNQSILYKIKHYVTMMGLIFHFKMYLCRLFSKRPKTNFMLRKNQLSSIYNLCGIGYFYVTQKWF